MMFSKAKRFDDRRPGAYDLPPDQLASWKRGAMLERSERFKAGADRPDTFGLYDSGMYSAKENKRSPVRTSPTRTNVAGKFNTPERLDQKKASPSPTPQRARASSLRTQLTLYTSTLAETQSAALLSAEHSAYLLTLRVLHLERLLGDQSDIVDAVGEYAAGLDEQLGASTSATEEQAIEAMAELALLRGSRTRDDECTKQVSQLKSEYVLPAPGP
ncbi:hypothetical protein RQP46_005844 [Phenoliferia psychrophenolica]